MVRSIFAHSHRLHSEIAVLVKPSRYFFTSLLFVLWLIFSTSGCAWMNRKVFNPIDQAHMLTAKAESAYDNHDYKHAEEMYEKAIETNPRDGDIHRKLAALLLTEGRIPEAIQHLNQAVEKSPDDPETQFQLGKLLYEQGELVAARECMDRTLQIDPAHTDGLALRAEIALKEDDEETAIATYHRILTVNPNNVSARIHVAELQLKHGHPERAAPILRDICDCNFASSDIKAEAYWKLGDAYARMQRWEDAADSYQVAQMNRPSQNADEWYRVAFTHYQAGHWPEAEFSLQQALNFNRNHPHALSLANTIAQQRMQAAAVQQTAGQPPPQFR
ncbi:MAG: tetratricopeptide repeat protein [Planctomycetaceae bacterium]|nr:tetratricopeptide repeat protein [Planctomycetaceae bacterium]